MKKVESDTQVSILVPISHVSCVRKVSAVNYSHYLEESVIESHCQILSAQRPRTFCNEVSLVSDGQENYQVKKANSLSSSGPPSSPYGSVQTVSAFLSELC